MKKLDIENKRFYKKEATKYEKTNELGLWKSEIGILKKYIKPNQSIMEIGTGTGRVALNLMNILPSLKILAVDYSKDMLDMFPQTKNIDCSLLDITEYKIDLVNKFDVILFMFNGLENIIEESGVQKALKNINKYLKPKGLFIFSIHNMFSKPEYETYWKQKLSKNNSWDQKTLEIKKYSDASAFQHFYLDEDIKSKLKETNFTIIEKINRNKEFKEFDWVLEYSEDCDFFVVQKND
ncbi:class I SAM-dependent methyltransferase [Mycoplasma enhydrae]|uniref:class I SAM-dependent methyltransferase n=1 Tax=Mycoplasma enhydrae TaxID=2499220 RepID=UPI0021E85BE6|nr:class I SAM-dependent methyltransferase [Mycoplasma enhydrae]MCV3753408.1 class I SAM-dependent methyltransferase [Mycoplasma enhydrae]